jgi:spore germination protein GerM
VKKLIILIGALALMLTACGAADIGSAGPVTTKPAVETTTTTAGGTTTTSSAPSGDTGSTTTTTTTEAPADQQPADQVFVDLYFVKEGLSAATVTRAVDSPQVATNAIKALIAGPTPAEMDTELSSSIPADTLLLGLTIDNGLATIDLSREFEVGGGSFNMLSRLAQVVYTLTQFPTVDEVLFYIDGEPVDVFSGEGIVLDGPVTRADYLSALPLEPVVDTGPAPLWHQGDMPDITGVSGADLGKVVLVAANDVLNVREDAGTSAAVVGTLAPGVIVEKTGAQKVVGSSIWEQIVTPLGDHWVNGRFLGAVVSAAYFAADARIGVLLDEFASIISNQGDLRQVISQRGLYVSYNAPPIRFSPDDLDGILTDATTYKWPSNALGPDQLDEVPARTFAEAITDSFLSAYDDPDTQLSWNDPIAGGNGRLPGNAIPFEFAGFNYVGVYDPGDDPQYGGLDWTTWYVSIDYEGGDPVIVGLTVDMWAP